jgi:hypothetical protein
MLHRPSLGVRIVNKFLFNRLETYENVIEHLGSQKWNQLTLTPKNLELVQLYYKIEALPQRKLDASSLQIEDA